MGEIIKYCEVVGGKCKRPFKKLQCASCGESNKEIQIIAQELKGNLEILDSSRNTKAAKIVIKGKISEISIREGKKIGYSKTMGTIRLGRNLGK